MKKFFILTILFSMLLVYGTAYAVSLPPGPVWGHFSNWSSIGVSPGTNGDTNGDGIIGFGEKWFPQSPGDEGRALGFINQFYDANTGKIHWSPGAAEELTITEYDFVAPTKPTAFPGQALDAAAVYFVPGPTYGGLIDVWLDTTPDWATGGSAGGPIANLGPSAWVRPGHGHPTGVPGDTHPVGHDDYPGASDSVVGGAPGAIDPAVSLWLWGTYAPLFVDANLNSKFDLGEQLGFDDLNGNGVQDPGESYLVWEIANYSSTGIGTASGWMDVLGGTYANQIVDGSLGTFAGYTYDISITADLSPSKYGTPYSWQTKSSDPTYMEVVPEPSTILLLGAGLISIAALGRKRIMRKK